MTSSSGPGIALKTEAMGLAISTELPLVIVNVQRGGPSTGLPTKTEQADLNQAVFGRNGDAPLPVLAAATPADCFDRAIEAVHLATRFMTPVMLLSDGYIANAAEPWKIPDMAAPAYAVRPVHFHADPEGFQPFRRDPQTGARPWAVPGTAGLGHSIGGLAKDFGSGNVSYDRDNHQLMTDARVGKIAGIADHLPPQTIEVGPDRARWRSSPGARPMGRRGWRCVGPWPAAGRLRIFNSAILAVAAQLGQFAGLFRPHPAARNEHRPIGRPLIGAVRPGGGTAQQSDRPAFPSARNRRSNRRPVGRLK